MACHIFDLGHDLSCWRWWWGFSILWEVPDMHPSHESYTGWGYKRECISIFLYLSSHASSWLHGRCIWCYWRAETGIRFTSADFEGLYERSHTALCVVSNLSPCCLEKLKALFWIPSESTSNSISVSWGSGLDEKPPKPHNTSPALTAVSISPIKLP